MVGRIALILIYLLLMVTQLSAQDPNDPLDSGEQVDLSAFSSPFDNSKDEEKSADELISDATILLADERPLDARTKLLKALSKDPKNYKAHLLLGGYYLVHVGHFRLSLKYVKQAEALFLAQHGNPPYADEQLKNEHSQILYLISEIRLNLDNYQGALESLDYFNSLYFRSWYPGSRAWVLMKLGRLDEAVRVAKVGLLAGAEPGRTLNILGILLSMVGKEKESLEIFNEAILTELSMGSQGQPATPLNNQGEVYHEIFQEDKAESSWRKATSMPDGCEHVLPSLNLTILLIEQLRFKEATQAMDRFEQCIAQYPLRNGEEHKALVHLARGRIDQHTGNIDTALEHLDAAIERRQWFGKIGTSLEDLASAATSSLAQALIRKNNILSFRRDVSWLEWASARKEMVENSLRAWWLMRRARQILAEDLSNLEDINIRHTDSLLEYHTLGETLAGFSPAELERRISNETKNDKRDGAMPYYKAYLAENYLEHGRRSEGLKLIDQALSALRTGPDAGLKLHLLLLTLRNLDPGSKSYNSVAQEIYQSAPAELRNFGFRLPVDYSGVSQDALSQLSRSAFIPIKDTNLRFTIVGKETSEGYQFEFSSTDRATPIRVQDKKLERAVDQLTDAVFKQ